MEIIFLFLTYFIIIYLLYLITVVLQNKKMEKFKKSKQVQFFVRRYGLDFNKISIKKFTNIIALTNSLIMAITLISITYISNYVLKLMVAFVILFPLIYIGYGLLGMYIKKTNTKKEGK